MDGPELIRELGRSLERAQAARPDIAPEDLLATLGPGDAQSIEEFNASGEVMCFVCVPVTPRDFGSDDIVPGSFIAVCQGCCREVWISPATSKLRERITNKRLLCGECAMKELPKKDPTMKLFTPPNKAAP